MKTILVAGSSIFEQWSCVDRVAPECEVRNRAVGGSITSYWIEHLADVVQAESPDALLFYCGSNDFVQDVPEAQIIANVGQCCRIAHDVSPGLRFAYFGIIKAKAKRHQWTRIERVNAAIAAALPAGDIYVETNKIFFRNGQLIDEYFVEDGTHHTPEAYERLTEFALPILAECLRGGADG